MSSKKKNRIKIQFESIEEVERYSEALAAKNLKFRVKRDSYHIIIFFPKHLEKKNVLNALEKGIKKKNFSYEVKY